MSEKATAQTAVITYESQAANKWRSITLLATVCLIVFFPLPLVWMLMNLSGNGSAGTVAMGLLCLTTMSSCAFFLVAFNTYRKHRNSRLVLTEGNIFLPDAEFNQSDPKNRISWSDVDKISVAKDPSNSKNDALVIDIRDRLPVRLPLSVFSLENLDKLVSACDLWSNRWARDASFDQLIETVTHGRSGQSDTSFTSIWMQEAHRRLSSTPFVPLEPGRVLQDGRVKVVQIVGSGGWSAIYLCHWREKTPAILKEAVFPPGISEEIKQKAAEQFDREVVLLSGLDHPQIAKVLDHFVENGRQYMTLERITGPNLRSYVKDRGAISEAQTLKWTNELARIISYLHDREPAIIHRDITPENLVIDMKGSLVLIDFGSANEFVGTVTGTLVGKPSYVSPEQFSGRANKQSDLYSLGGVINFMLTGKDPEPLTVAHPKSIEPILSDEIDALVADLMCLDLKKRLRNINEVIDRLQAVSH
jgi:tRNA A-37 threonylcarbamoyl transferase component Bud32